MSLITQFNSKETGIFHGNQLVLAAVCPCHKNWKNDSFNAHPLLTSVVLRVLFAIVAFIIFPIIISLLAYQFTFDNTKHSGLKIAKVFAGKDVFAKIPMRNGLTNFGNSCYLNTCIQLLATVDPLLECLKTGIRKSNLKDPLFALVAALKDPAIAKETTKEMLKEFRDLLLESGWNTGGRKGPHATNDTMELLFWLVDEFEADLPNTADILPPTAYDILLEKKKPDLKAYLNTESRPDSPFIAIHIKNPSSWFKPPHELTFGEDTFRLSGVVRRPGGNHYVFFQPLFNTLLGVTYDDSTTTVEKNVRTARALFYTKITK